jgi:hypothetical protein
VIWVKTDDTTTVKGVYAYLSSAWTLIADSNPSIVQASAEPTAASHPLWAKTDEVTDDRPRGIYYHDGSSYQRLVYPNAKEVILQATAPDAALWVRYLWAKSGTPTGLFRSDGTNWLSIGDVFQTTRYPVTGNVNIAAGPSSGVEYCTYANAYSGIPFISVQLEYDSSTDDFRWYVVPTSTQFEFHWYNASASARDIALRAAGWGPMTI